MIFRRFHKYDEDRPTSNLEVSKDFLLGLTAAAVAVVVGEASLSGDAPNDRGDGQGHWECKNYDPLDRAKGVCFNKGDGGIFSINRWDYYYPAKWVKDK
jgi:hypothetical protein